MEEVKQGRPWKNDSRYPSYEEADTRRKSILTEENNHFDVKIKRLSIGESKFAFFVKTRLKKEHTEQKKSSSKTKKHANRI
jgi:hypothetical protein